MCKEILRLLAITCTVFKIWTHTDLKQSLQLFVLSSIYIEFYSSTVNTSREMFYVQCQEKQ